MQKKSFFKMMEELYQAENELINLTDEEIAELLGDVKGKVDGLRDWIEKLKAEEKRIGDDIKLLQEKKKSVANARERFRSYVANVMAANETPKIFGNTWTISCSEREYIRAKEMEITTLDFATLNKNASTPVVKRKYSFDADQLKKAYKEEPEKYGKYVEVERKPSIRFNAKKD